MSRTVTAASEEGSERSGSVFAGKADGSVAPSSAVATLPVGSVAGVLAAARVADEDSAASPPPQPASAQGTRNRPSNTVATERARVFTRQSLAARAPGPGYATAACILSPAPGELRAPIV